LIPKE
jgi:hypothetical protein